VPSGAEGEEFRGAEVEVSMLFADVRGSSKLARQMSVLDFTRLMNRFYRVSTDVLIDAEAIVEKFVGDEVVGLFIPFMTGPEHAKRAVQTAEELLLATGHSSGQSPWVPLGAGVHTGSAFVGIVGSDGASDFTALGDPVNIGERRSLDRSTQRGSARTHPFK
jgi:adenylate cyclase